VARGTQRERAVRHWLEEHDYVVLRAAGSLGYADLIALRNGGRPLLIEVKATARGPYNGFGPADRANLKAYAERAGALATLAWWPPRGKLRWIPSEEWPT
jgi:Holliday junction resolvase